MQLSTALAVLGALVALPVNAEDIREAFKAGLAESVHNAEAEAEHSINTRNAQPRLFGDSVSGYSPYPVDCPQNYTWVRSANAIGDDEKNYLNQRAASISSAVNSLLAAQGLPNPARTPVLGLALSGGGYRAMINGLGMTMATMSQSDEAKKSGIGGWLDAMSYMAGLSGGSWATGSFVANGGPLPIDLVNNVWDLESNLIVPSDGKLKFYTDLTTLVKQKQAAGFPTQITDLWSLALGEHLLPADYHMRGSHGPNLTLDELPSTVSQLGSASLPYPIIIAAERKFNSTAVLPVNASYFEFTPHEFGSWALGYFNKTQGFFTPTKHLGTNLTNGNPRGQCWSGFDQTSFAMGTSSTLFNYGLTQLNSTESTILTSLISTFLQDLSNNGDDIAVFPNSFQGLSTADQNPVFSQDWLTLVDGGETNQNVPLEPLVVNPRNLDAILAFDNSADTTYSWPNGSSLFYTYEAAKEYAKYPGLNYRMPPVPSINGFVNGGLNTRPTFFGCNNTDTPLIVYVPNYPWSWYSNSSTFAMDYKNATAQSQMESTMRALTLNGTVPTWPKCLACALTDRANKFTAENRPSDCQDCFNTWCWDGTDDTSDPKGEYEPLAGVTPQFLVDKKLSNNVQTTPIQPTSRNNAAVSHAASGLLTTAAALGAALFIL